MENFKNLIRAFCVVVATVLMASSATAADDAVGLVDDGGMSKSECEDIGGERIPQPAGSVITACCFASYCTICDENGEDCNIDPVYSSTEDTSKNFTGLHLYYSNQRGDNFSAATPKGFKAASDAGYRRVRKQGCILTKKLSGTVPLNLYWHAGRGDNFTTATGAGDAQAAGYKFVRTLGYIYTSRLGNTVPLRLHWSAERGDNFTSATSKGASDASAAKYRSIRDEGYIAKPSFCD